MNLSFLQIFNRVVGFVGDAAITIWLFSTLKSRGIKRELISLLFLLPIAVYFDLSPWAGLQGEMYAVLGEELFLILRVVIRCLLNWAYLKTSKEKNSVDLLYLSVFFNLLRMAASIRSGFFKTGMLSMQGRIIITLCNIILEVVIVLVVHRFIDLDRMKTRSKLDWVIIIIGILTSAFLKSTLTSATQAPELGNQISVIVYALFTTFGFLLIFILIETQRQMMEDQNRQERELMIANYNDHYLRRVQKSDQDIRRLYHDMKNHLIVIRELNGDNKSLESYLENLKPFLEEYELLVNTGNKTVDAVISEKISIGKLSGISFNVYMDLTRLSFVKPVDLVAVFGNMLDNAIEAEEKLSDPKRRRIFLKSDESSGFLVINCTNFYEGQLNDSNGSLSTTKKDNISHGIGLGSIRSSVESYGGYTHIQFNNEIGEFKMTIAFPLQGE